jgi:hypothetical protein
LFELYIKLKYILKLRELLKVMKSNDSLLQKDFSVLKEAIEKEKSAAELDLIGQSCLIEQQHKAVVLSPEKVISSHKEDIVASSSASAKLDLDNDL